jgi:sterol desaturase/sphingolipid hydroxylase (fatty acid hydroxylase superfamily)
MHSACGLAARPPFLAYKGRGDAGVTNFGRGAGVASGILGVLCVFAELCFLFPHHLVYHEARPFYVAHLEFFRGLLLVCIVATFILGFVGVLLGRSKHAAAGLVLGIASILLGGPRAEALTEQPSTLTVGLDYFVLSLFVLGLVFIPMERLWPLRDQPIFRRGWQTDVTHFFANHVGIQLTAFFSIIPVQLFFAWAVDNPLQRAIASQPLWLQFFGILFVVDLASYWAHRAFHQIPLLWRFHSVHHSVENMDWLAGSRLHLVDVVVTRLIGFLPVFLLGFSAGAVYAYLIFVSFHAVYIHANVRHRWPVIRGIFTTPEFHHWHHAADAEAVDKNFAVLLSFIDRMFGTAYMPGRWPSRYGLVSEKPPESYLGQLAFPFRRS